MPNPENIIPPKKGEVRNPKGKPPGTKNRATILRKWIEINAKITDPETKKVSVGTMEDKIALALVAKANTGDVQAIKEINDTLYGKIAEKGELKVDEKINITFNPIDKQSN
jgi:hypothetical protein